MNITTEIKNRINILDLAVEYGLHPDRSDFIFSIYKEEKNRSLKLYPQTNSYYCFATGQGGSIIKFYADYWKITIKEAVKELADKVLLNNDQYKNNRVSRLIPQRNSQKKSIIVLESEKRKYEEVYGKSPDKSAVKWIMKRRKEIQINIYESLEKFCFGPNSEALEYLQSKKRGLKPETIKRFRLFSLTNIKWVMEYLNQNFSNDELLISGLINNKGNFVFNSHKLIIPYIENDKITYLRGRTLESSGYFSKYLSLSNFSGNLTLKRFFNIETLKNMSRDENLYICEGEFDAMIMEQLNCKAIAVPGVTNIPEDKIHIIRNYNVYLVFDNDEAGKKANKKMSEMINKEVKGIKLNKYKDITELICNNK